MKEVQTYKKFDLTLPSYDEGGVPPCQKVELRGSHFKFSALLDHVDTSEATSDEHLEHVNNAGSALAWCLSMALESESAAALLFSLPLEKWTISLSKEDTGYYFDSSTHHLTVGLDEGTAEILQDSPFLRNTLFFDFLYALRDIWFETYTGALSAELHPEDYLKWERFRQADISSFSILCSWEILNSGDDSLWRHVTAFENGDMALAFVRKLTHPSMQSAKGLEDAQWQAFKTWYRDHDRVTFCDRDTLSYMDDRILEQGNTFGRTRFNAEFMKEIANLSGFQSYFEGNEKDLTRAPEFSLLPDEICQTHLLHIISDLESVEVAGIRFRDRTLASKIFPDQH